LKPIKFKIISNKEITLEQRKAGYSTCALDQHRLTARREQKNTLLQVYDELNGCCTWAHIGYLLEDLKKEVDNDK